MKLDADEKELLESVERGEWKARQGWQARAHSLRQSHVPQGPTAEHPAVEQRSGGDPEASARAYDFLFDTCANGQTLKVLDRRR
jgi:hypothetical protein